MKIKKGMLVSTALCALWLTGCSSNVDETQTQATPALNQKDEDSAPRTMSEGEAIGLSSSATIGKKSEDKRSQIAPSASASVGASTTYSLQAALNRAHEYSLRTVISMARVDEAEQRIDEAKAGYYPKLQAMVKTADWISDRSSQVSRSYDEYSQMQLTLQYNLMDFGRTRHAVGSAENVHRSATLGAENEINSVSFDAAKAYLDVRRYTLLQAAAKDYVKVTSDLVNTLTARVAGGGSPESELIRGKLALTNAENRQKTIDLQLAKAKQKLRSLLGIDVAVEMAELADIPGGTNFDAMVASILQQNPGIKAKLAELDSAKEDVSVAQAARYPSVDVVGAYKRPFQRPDGLDNNYLGGNVALQVSVPVLDGGINSSRIGQAMARLRVAEASYGQLQRDVNEMAFNLSNDAVNARELWKIQGQAKLDAGRTKSLYLEEFRLGNRSLNDLISVQTDFFNASVGRVSSQYDYYLSVMGLYMLLGQVNSGIQTLNLR
ncbi:transporter [Leminorella grimontii]|uniref:Transporter n=1 Tax=Leminorella grimontii TaxID=82981 RepID=A0AAV5NA73_9GAMM|nr:TolC family protein [Leminorella grimontii]GKX57497.1 transporter [Leminorella grimontii]VFS62135.1 outer membrane channel protein [Leminorella grimontii]